MGFGISLYGVPVNRIKVNSEYSIDIVTDEVTMGFLVSKYEENSVRAELRYTIKQWRQLSPQERAEEIAIRRINQKIEYVKFLKGAGKL